MNAGRFSSAINQHLNNPSTMRIRGTFHKQDAVHHLDPATGLNVVSDTSGNFITGYQLSGKQQTNLLLHGGLGGG